MDFPLSFVVVVLLVLTKHGHSRYSLDPANGVKKVHSMTTPRVGCIVIIVCALEAYAVAQPER
jgi:UDP-N-acetylmuramyl pentapeptide phosphotransferase/UDP-N-acetylglucosamine-1-phosphate transferase